MIVIPVCFKCQSPLDIISQPEDGLEIVRYQCLQCRRSSASFLLGYVEPSRPKADGVQMPEENNYRAQSFSGVDKQYRLHARIQALLERTSKDTRRKIRPVSKLRDVE